MEKPFMWIGFWIAMLEIAIAVYFPLIKKRPTPMIPVCICSALALVFVMLHFSTR